MAINSIAGTPARPHPAQAPASRINRPDGRRSAGDDLQKQLREQRESSLDWQVLKSTLHCEDAEGLASGRHQQAASNATPADTQAPDQTAPAVTPERRTTASGDSVTLEYVHAEMHLSQISVDRNGVQVTEADFTYDRLVLSRTRAAPPEPKRSDPLALDLNGDGRIRTTGIAGGQAFDLNADGRVDRSSVVSGGDAFVAIDRNGNGRIDDGSELFGDQTGAANGFEALRAYDDNQDGRIDATDRVYAQLKLLNWSADGQQQIRTLDQAGVQSIDLGYRQDSTALNATDTITQSSSFTRDDGSTGLAGDLLLGYAN